MLTRNVVTGIFFTCLNDLAFHTRIDMSVDVVHTCLPTTSSAVTLDVWPLSFLPILPFLIDQTYTNESLPDTPHTVSLLARTIWCTAGAPVLRTSVSRCVFLSHMPMWPFVVAAHTHSSTSSRQPTASGRSRSESARPRRRRCARTFFVRSPADTSPGRPSALAPRNDWRVDSRSMSSPAMPRLSVPPTGVFAPPVDLASSDSVSSCV
jgi:hypothetical protein